MLSIEDDYSALMIEAIKKLLKAPQRSVLPTMGIHGCLCMIPINVWLMSGQTDVELVKDNEDAALELIKQGVPSTIMRRMLGPFNDEEKIETCMPQLPNLPPNFLRGDDVKGCKATDEVKRMAVKAMTAYCVYCFICLFLARGEDAVKALHYPGDPLLKLSRQQRVALGIVRELVILNHFSNLHEFWQELESLMKNNWQFIDFDDSNDELDRLRVEELLGGDAQSLRMYNLMIDLTSEAESLCDHVCVLDEYREYNLSETIDLPKSVRHLLHK